jgi:hypothetical protein
MKGIVKIVSLGSRESVDGESRYQVAVLKIIPELPI